MFSFTKASSIQFKYFYHVSNTMLSGSTQLFKIYHGVKAVTSSPCDKCFRYPVDYSHI